MARSCRRRTRSYQESTEPTETCEDKLRFRIAFAEYLRASAESVNEAWWFTLRGRHQWGLSLHLGLDTRQYSALLLACGLVSTTKATPGASPVSCSEPLWREDFLSRYGLYDGIHGHCEVTTGGIDPNRIGSTKQTYTKMLLLRIGKYNHKGETNKASSQINDGEVHATDVTFNHKHRTAQRRLFNDIRDDFSKYLFDDRIDEVMRWVEIADDGVENDSNGKCDSSDDEEDKMDEKVSAVVADDEHDKKSPESEDSTDNEHNKKPPASKDLNDDMFKDVDPEITRKFMALMEARNSCWT